MAITVQSYSVQFVPDPSGQPTGTVNWNYAPAAGTDNLAQTGCQIQLATSDTYAVIVLNLQPMNPSLVTTLFNTGASGLSWTQNGQSISQPSGITVTYSPDSTVLIITDENDNDDSYGFLFQVTYNGQNYTSSDPIIVNKDTGSGGGGYHPIKKDVAGIRESLAEARTRES
jgi:hypothetical protein